MAANEEGTSISIDQEEFTRLQTQLIDLRTKNYQLQEEQSKKDAEYQQLLNNLQTTTKELEKANKTIQRSKKTKEFQLLAEENESLQQRLHTQEEDFKLQNKTLMDELAKVFEEKDILRRSKDKSEKESPGLTRLQAENTALQKSLQVLQDQLKNDGSTSDEGGPSTAVASVDVNLVALEEEKKLLQKHLEETEEKGRKELVALQSQVDKLDEKTRKKQELIVQLQNEKEKLISESKNAYDGLCEQKDKIIQSLKNEIEQLKENEAKKQQNSKNMADLIQQVNSLTREKEELSIKCQHMREHQDTITKEKENTKTLLKELGQELQQSRRELVEQKEKCHRLEEEVKNTQQASDELADQIMCYREEKMKLEANLANIEKVAEKRKTLLDEMAIKEQEKATEKKRKEDELTDAFQKEIESLKIELQNERDKSQELSSSVEELNDLRRRIKSMENMKELYEEQLQNTKEAFEKKKNELQTKLDEVQKIHEEELSEVKRNLEEETNKVNELNERVSQLEIEVDEKSQEILIAGKKSTNLIKDLKKQLQQFQKREEKLQEQLQLQSPSLDLSITSESKHSRESSLSSTRGGNELPLTPVTGSLTQQDIFDGENKEDIQTLLDKVAALQQEKWLLEEKVNHLEMTSSSLAEDVIQKSTIIQNHFMLNKADHASTTSNVQVPGKMSPMRLVQWAKTPGKEETMAEINRKMQRALEESLMKNIHLQKNVDMLSSELQNKNSSKDITADTTDTP